MELRDYIRMLRRGWLTIAAMVVVGALLGLAYLRVTPAVYQSTVAMLAAPRNAGSLGDLQLGAQYATASAPTIATLIQSSAVLDPAAAGASSTSARTGGRPISAGELAGGIAVTAQESASVIYITASSDDPERAAQMATLVSTSAADVVPGLVASDPRASSSPLLTLEVIQDAAVPGAPVSPDRRRVLTLTVVIGLALGLALTITRQSLDSRILGADDLRSVTGVKLLAVLPRRRTSKKQPVVVRDAPNSASVEAYRVLRTNLGQSSGEARRSLLFAPVADDGFAPRVPVNIAWSMAQAGRRVLLIDLDLRGSVVADLLGLQNQAGSSELLSGGEPREVVRHTAQPLLEVITSGTSSQAPADLLSGPALARVVRAAEQDYDFVMISAPPLLAYSDAAVVARVVTETVVVVRTEETRAPELTAALEVLSNVGVQAAGIVLTGSKNSVVELSRLLPFTGRPTNPPRGNRSRRHVTEADS